MAKQVHISRKELEQDQTLETLDHVFFWLSHNRNLILGVLVVVTAAFLAAGVIRQRNESRMADASDQLFHAIRLYEDALEKHAYASQGRRDAMAEVRQIADKVIEEFNDSPAARNALFLKGNAYYFEGDAFNSRANTDEAIKVFEAYLAEAQDDYERAAAMMALGYAHENLSLLTADSGSAAQAALEQSLRYYDQIIALEGAGFLRNEAKLAKARLYTAGGQNDQARKLYEEVLLADYVAPPEPGPDATQDERVLSQIKFFAGQFSTGNTARIHLERLGADPDEILKKAKESRETAQK